jgi:hypothetical protein
MIKDVFFGLKTNVHILGPNDKGMLGFYSVYVISLIFSLVHSSCLNIIHFELFSFFCSAHVIK